MAGSCHCRGVWTKRPDDYGISVFLEINQRLPGARVPQTGASVGRTCQNLPAVRAKSRKDNGPFMFEPEGYPRNGQEFPNPSFTIFRNSQKALSIGTEFHSVKFAAMFHLLSHGLAGRGIPQAGRAIFRTRGHLQAVWTKAGASNRRVMFQPISYG